MYTSSLIINHSLSDDALIKLCTKTCAYNLLHGQRIHYDTHCSLRYCIHDAQLEHDQMGRDHTTFCDATRNGLRVTDISVHDKFMNDDHTRYCTSLVALKIYNNNCKITTCAPFAESLKVLYSRFNCKIGDEGLRLCTSIVELHATNNVKITTCRPFAETLTILYAEYICRRRYCIMS